MNINTKKQKSIFKNPLFVVFLAFFIAAAYLYLSLYLPPLKTARLKFSDYLLRWRHGYYEAITSPRLYPRDIVLVTIDEESYKQLKKRWPWGRNTFADFLDKLSKHKPKVIALDFALYGESPDNPEADKKLAKSIKESGNVIIASVYGKDKLYLGPYDIFAKASAGYGVIGAIRDRDSAIRRLKVFALVLASGKGGDISFELKSAAHYLDVPYNRIYQEGQNVILESEDEHINIPLDDNGHILINYSSDVKDIKTIPIWKVISGDISGRVFKDKLVLVSQTGEIFHDVHLTPFGYRPGGLIIANVLNSILSSSYLRGIDFKFYAVIFALLYALAFIIFYKLQPVKSFFALIFILAAYLVISFCFFVNNIILPTFDIVVLLSLLFLSMTFYKYGIVVLDAAEVRRMAITDSLTSLYTHRYFRFLLEHTIKKALGFGNKCSIIVLKITNFDKIIKGLSFNKGQTIQRKMAELIRAKITKNGSGAFLGMGEFAMLMPKVGLYEALGIAGSLRNNIKKTDFDIREEAFKPAVAIGVSAINKTGFPKTGTELIRSARTAMGRARVIGYNKICRFNAKIDSSVFEPNIMEKEIRQRLDDEFGFLAIDLEERNKELENLLHQLSITQRDLEHAHFETLRSLVVALEEKDPCTAGHSERVGGYAEEIGKKLKMPEEEVKLLKEAAVLHDIGKIGIPQNILRKEGSLSISEKHIIELHPEFSVRILTTSKYFSKILHAIQGHHERLDGSGYPRGLKGNQLSLEAQIVAVADVFDALSTDRPYRKAYTRKEAMGKILSEPEKYNNNIACLLKQILEEK